MSIAKVAGEGMRYNASVVADRTHRISKYNTGIEKDTNLASDIVDTMVAQKHFEANAKMITTSDEMLEIILAMK